MVQLMNSTTESEKSEVRSMKERELMEMLAERPEARQVDLAARLGVAVGTINWYLKRFAAKGYIKVKRIGRWKWGYILTPKGMTELSRMTTSYVHGSMSLYRTIRVQSTSLIGQVKDGGFWAVRLEGEGDVADVVRLTCVEHGIRVTDGTKGDRVPVIRVRGKDLALEWPREKAGFRV